jgi:redox-sensitive bicupin YhaK (pirin superfamily)
MSNAEARPVELVCGQPPGAAQAEAAEALFVEVLTARDVPLGGPRAMAVRRTLPQRARSLIGAWCFADHYGPQDADAHRMAFPPHPHTGLQTVSWLFSGAFEHRDSMGTRALVRPGELNLMTAGRGICHSEDPPEGIGTLHGVQLWVALPDAHRHTARDFRHYVPPVTDLGGASARVFLGELAGSRSPVPTFSPLLGAELVLAPGAELSLEIDPGFEHGVLVDTGSVRLAGTELVRGDLGYLATGAARLPLANATEEPARVLLLGGEPFGEQIVMWWNFVGRSHEEIVAFREGWESGSEQFGTIDDYPHRPKRLPAPQLPNARLRPREAPPSR